MSANKCTRPACNFTKNPDVHNNGGTHCCKACQTTAGAHGPACTSKHAIVSSIPTIAGQKPLPGAGAIARPSISVSPVMAAANAKAIADAKAKAAAALPAAKPTLPLVQPRAASGPQAKVIGKCATLACLYGKNPDLKTGDGIHCCATCKTTPGHHATTCAKASVVPVTSAEAAAKSAALSAAAVAAAKALAAATAHAKPQAKCARPNCSYPRSTDAKPPLTPFCCKECMAKAGDHGVDCISKKPAPAKTT